MWMPSLLRHEGVSVNTTAIAPKSLSVVVPAFRCAAMLRRCLAALSASTLSRSDWELIVVDDSSGDDTTRVPDGIADLVLVTPAGPRGPGFARNLGAIHATGNVLVFVDADVLVAPVTLAQFKTAFASNADVAAIHGAYDDQPGEPGFISQYRNLLHHWVHTNHAGESTTFWAGCGAVRREAFLAVGGFDAERFPRPQIEDIELGYRLVDHGLRILLDPTIQGRHLKRWTLRGLSRTDLLDRAIPWMHLLISRKHVANDGPLNLQAAEKVMTASLGVALLSLLVFALTGNLIWLWISVAGVAAILVGNLPLFRWFARVRGVPFALAVIPMRLLYYATCVLGAGWALTTHRWMPEFRSRRPSPTLGTSSSTSTGSSFT